MDEYISKQRAKDLMGCCLASAKANLKVETSIFKKAEFESIIKTVESMIDVVGAVEAADVQPVKRGKWEQDEKGAFHHCSECESKTFRDVDSWGYEYQEYLTDYCFRCGARMDGEQDENN